MAADDPWPARIAAIGVVALALGGASAITLLALEGREIPLSLGGLSGTAGTLFGALIGYIFGRANGPPGGAPRHTHRPAPD